MLRKSVERVVKFTRDHKNTIIEVAAIASAGVKVYNFVKSKIDDERDRMKTKAKEDIINDLDGMRTYGYVEFKPIDETYDYRDDHLTARTVYETYKKRHPFG